MNRKILILTRRIFEQIINKGAVGRFSALLKALAFVVILAIITSKDAFINFNDTNTFLFVLSCSVFFIGMSNTLQEVCKERAIVKRELQAKIYNPFQYIMSKIVSLCIIGFLQTLCLIIPLAFILDFPSKGLVFDSFLFEMIVTTFLSIVSAGSMTLLVSASAKSTERTMGAMPVLILIQIVLSGVIMKLDKPIMKILSYFTISKWTMDAYGTSSNINMMHEKLQNVFYQMGHEPKPTYIFESSHLWQIWGMLLVIAVLFAWLSMLTVKEIVNDGR